MYRTCTDISVTCIFIVICSNIEQEVKTTPEPVIPEEPELKLSPEPPLASSRHKHSGSNKSKDDQRKKSIAKLTSKQGKTSPSPQHQEETPL